MALRKVVSLVELKSIRWKGFGGEKLTILMMAFLCEMKSFEIAVCSGHGLGKNSCNRLLGEIALV